MTELEKIFLTSGLTIFGGVIVLIVGQILTRFFIEPLHDLRKLIGEIGDVLIFHANVFSNPGVCSKEDNDKTSEILRQKASLLRTRTFVISCFWVFVLFRIVPSRKRLNDASRYLINLSNSVHRGNGLVNSEHANKVKKLLGLPPD